MNYKPKCGDIFLCDSNRIGAKIVKFLMQASTLWEWLYKDMVNLQEEVRFYHGGMILNNKEIIEQQWKVQKANINKIFSRDIIIYRYKNLNGYFSKLIAQRAEDDLGKGYDILQVIGKFLTWLIGFKFFVRFLGALSKEEEICVSRIGDWYDGICDFGVKTKHELTTKIIDEYCQMHPEEWEIVYENKRRKIK